MAGAEEQFLNVLAQATLRPPGAQCRRSCRLVNEKFPGTDMSIMNALASVAVKDLNSAVQWYEEVLGKPPDSRPMPEVAEWKFERGGWLQVYELPERAGSGSVTLSVSSIDDHVAQLDRLGIDTRQRSSDDKVKPLMIGDPDGNHIAFAEAIDPSMAQ